MGLHFPHPSHTPRRFWDTHTALLLLTLTPQRTLILLISFRQLQLQHFRCMQTRKLEILHNHTHAQSHTSTLKRQQSHLTCQSRGQTGTHRLEQKALERDVLYSFHLHLSLSQPHHTALPPQPMPRRAEPEAEEERHCYCCCRRSSERVEEGEGGVTLFKAMGWREGYVSGARRTEQKIYSWG